MNSMKPQHTIELQIRITFQRFVTNIQIISLWNYTTVVGTKIGVPLVSNPSTIRCIFFSSGIGEPEFEIRWVGSSVEFLPELRWLSFEQLLLRGEWFGDTLLPFCPFTSLFFSGVDLSIGEGECRFWWADCWALNKNGLTLYGKKRCPSVCAPLMALKRCPAWFRAANTSRLSANSDNIRPPLTPEEVSHTDRTGFDSLVVFGGVKGTAGSGFKCLEFVRSPM